MTTTETRKVYRIWINGGCPMSDEIKGTHNDFMTALAEVYYNLGTLKRKAIDITLDTEIVSGEMEGHVIRSTKVMHIGKRYH